MSPYVGIIISFVVFGIGSWAFKKSKGFFLFTPLFVAMILGVFVLKVTDISYEQYNEGGKFISFFLEICFFETAKLFCLVFIRFNLSC